MQVIQILSVGKPEVIRGHRSIEREQRTSRKIRDRIGGINQYSNLLKPLYVLPRKQYPTERVIYP